MNKKTNSTSLFLLLFSAIAFFISSCDGFNSTVMNVKITADQASYEYGDTITATLDIQGADGSLTIQWLLDGVVQSGETAQSISLVLEPATTTTYTLTVKVSDGVNEETATLEFSVSQIDFIGTWRATNETTLVGGPYDIIGVWQVNAFELYYLTANGGMEPLDFSAMGEMTFPTEGSVITLNEQYSWDYDTQTWNPYSATFYAEYNFTDTDHLTMTVDLDTTSPPTAYQWDFVKIDDSVDSWLP